MPPKLATQRAFSDPDTGGVGTGELWVAAAGEIGQAAVRAPAFAGEKPLPETIEKQGVLHEYPFIAGVVYFTNGEFYSVVNRKLLNGSSAILVNRLSRQVVAGTG